MTIKYQYDKDNNLLTLNFFDVLKSDEIVTYFSELLDKNIVDRGFIEVVDLNDVTDLTLTYFDLERLYQISKKLNKIGHKVTLICAYTEKSKKIAAMMLPIFQNINFSFHISNYKADLDNNLRLFIN